MKPVPPVLSRILQPRDAPALEASLTLENVEVPGVQWAGREGKRASFDTMRFLDPDLTSAKLQNGGWADVEIQGGTLAGADLTGTTLRRVAVHHIRGSGLVVSETEGKDITAADSKFDLANFRFARWSRVEFTRCSLGDADFAGAHLSDVSFADCDLTGCDFSGATLKNVDLRGSAFEHLKGLRGLGGAIMTYDQLMGLVPELAAELHIILK